MRSPLRIRFGLGCLVLACVVGQTLFAVAQVQRPAGQQSPEREVVNTGEVMLDAVVRDKRGHVVKDLTAADVEVYEDGVKQQTNSFRFVSSVVEASDRVATKPKDQQSKRDEQGDRAKDAAVVNETGVPGVSAIALVFDRLSPEARPRATQAALSYLQESTNKDELFGVYVTDLSVAVLQPFTPDRELVKSG